MPWLDPPIVIPAQPKMPRRLVTKYSVPQAWVYNPSNRWVSNNGELTSLTQTNGAYTGSRFVTGSGGNAIRLFSDNAGNDDDYFQATLERPTARAGAYTTLFFARWLYDASNPAYLPIGGTGNVGSAHLIQHTTATGVFDLGYSGGNSYHWYGSITVDGWQNKDLCAVVSSVPGKMLSAAINGRAVTPTVGFESYIGQGTKATSMIPRINGNSGFTNYYHFNGLVHLWAEFPGLYITPAEALALSVNPFLIFESDNLSSWFETTNLFQSAWAASANVIIQAGARGA